MNKGHRPDHTDFRDIGTTYRYVHDSVLFEQESPLSRATIRKVSRSGKGGAETVVGLWGEGWLLGERQHYLAKLIVSPELHRGPSYGDRKWISCDDKF